MGGGGGGMGRGGGGGMGGVGGTGRGMGMLPEARGGPGLRDSGKTPPVDVGGLSVLRNDPPGDTEVERLREQARSLEDQLRAIHSRLTDIELRREPERRPPVALPVAVVNAELCIGCAICEDVCSFGAITVDDIARIDAKRCMGCGQCLENCPQEAISMSENQEPIPATAGDS
jgi:ferredoxin